MVVCVTPMNAEFDSRMYFELVDEGYAIARGP